MVFIPNSQEISPNSPESTSPVNETATDFKDKASSSWAEMVDTEIYVENKLLASSSFDSKGNKKMKNQIQNSYSISDIMIKDPKKIDDLTLLEYQTYISSHLKKYIKQCVDNIDTINFLLHIPKFEWLANGSKYLSEKLGLEINYHRITPEMSIIPRSSYKFCEYNYDCQFNYKNKFNGCFAQHFVHNLVHADLVAIINYLKYKIDTPNTINFEELLKCITTSSYVIKHMLEELSNLQFHYGSIDNIHFEKSVLLNKNKKKNHKSKCEKSNRPHRNYK